MPGLIDFNAGAILTAAQMDQVMQQCVISVANAAALPTTVHEGMTCYLQDANYYVVYNGGWVRLPTCSATSGRTGCFLRRTSTQSISNAVETAIQWDTENFDSDGFIAVTGSTVTIPSGLGGVYSISNRVVWDVDDSPATLGAYVQLDAGGETFRTPVVASGLTTTLQQMSAPCPTMALGVGDTVVLSVYQTSGSAKNITNAKLWLYRLSV